MPPALSPKTVTLVGIAAEGRDIGLHPLQRGEVVHHAVVGERLARLLGGQRRVGEEAEAAQAVVDGDQHHAALGEVGAVVDGVVPEPPVKAPPWIQTITGSLAPGLKLAGVQTLRCRQSSDWFTSGR